MHKLVRARRKSTGIIESFKFEIKGYRTKGGIQVKEEPHKAEIIKLICDPDLEYLISTIKD